MKKLLLLAATVISASALVPRAHAGLSFAISIGPRYTPPPVRVAVPAPVCPAPVVVAPAPVVVAPPTCLPPVVVAPPVCAAPRAVVVGPPVYIAPPPVRLAYYGHGYHGRWGHYRHGYDGRRY